MESKAINRADRPKRLTPNAERNRLTIPGLDTINFYNRFVIEDNVERYLAKGYTFVEQKNMAVGDVIDANNTGSKSSKVMKSRRGEKLYLMRIPMELYLQDREEIVKVARDQVKTALKDAKDKADYGTLTVSYGEEKV